MRLEAAYERAFAAAYTDKITITDQQGGDATTGVRAKVNATRSGDLVGAVEQSKIVLLVIAADCVTEPREGDTVTMRGRTYVVAVADPFARSRDGSALAYQLELEA